MTALFCGVNGKICSSLKKANHVLPVLHEKLDEAMRSNLKLGVKSFVLMLIVVQYRYKERKDTAHVYRGTCGSPGEQQTLQSSSPDLCKFQFYYKSAFSSLMG